ncbi:MAG TPA: DUF2726 domain-containing protein [Verrucomicrobiae bacterium]|nr:DUF2726 domain-containing protein [Verrucomicrobiae bacterium]
MNTSKDRFPLLRKILKAIGLPAEAIDDIVERILDWLSTKDESAGNPSSLPFKLRDDFLSPAEFSFYQVLHGVVGNRATICAKVNLADLFFPATGDHRKNRAMLNRIDRKHVDFLLCEPKTMRPLTGIELDDKSHERTDRKTRDELLGQVFAKAGLPLIRLPVKTGYVRSEVEQALAACLTGAPAASPAPAIIEDVPSTTIEPSCPKCGSKMVLRTAKSGTNAGGRFWGCSAFPHCRSILPVAKK